MKNPTGFFAHREIMKINFTDVITITQLFQNDDVKVNHFKSLNSTERRVCMASFRILKKRTIDNAPKKEHKHLKHKIIKNITEKLNGPEPVKGKKRLLHKINSFFKGIANRFFGRISSSKIQTAIAAYYADLNNATVEIKDLKMNIQLKQTELNTSNDEYEQLNDDLFKETRFHYSASIMTHVCNRPHLSKEFLKKTFDELPNEHKTRLEKINGKERKDALKELSIIVENIHKTFETNKKKFDVPEKKITGLKKNISRLNKQMEIRNKKYALETLDSSSESESEG